MRSNETPGSGDHTPKRDRKKPQVPRETNSDQAGIFEKRSQEPRSEINFARIARTFLEKDTDRLRFFRKGEDTTPTDAEVLEHMQGLQTVNEKLKASSGEIFIIQFQNPAGDYVAGVGRTNGEGLSLATDPETNEQQLTFGTNAVMQETIRDEEGNYRSTLTKRESIAIPEGSSIRVVTSGERFRSFPIGEDEIKRQVNVSGEMNAAWHAFLLEQVGIDPDRFFREYFTATSRFSEKRQREIENVIRTKITNARKAHDPDASEVPLIEIAEATEEAIPMQVFPITIEEGRLLIEDAPGSYVDLGGKINQTVAGSELAVNAFLGELRDNAQQAHYVSWEGNKVPRGASIQGREIADTRHGLAFDSDGEIIGSYVRLDQEQNDRQEMIVFTSNDAHQQ